MTRKDDLLRDAAQRLGQAGIADARREARLLLAWAAICDLGKLITLQTVDSATVMRFREGLKRRLAREPMAFITGRAGFWTLDLDVSGATLIPRADSEVLIEALLATCPEREQVRTILDLGTGTGCLLLAALSEYAQAFGVGVDLSPAAARLAADNATRHGLYDRSAFFAGSWATALQGRFDVVLSNPPYIERADIAGLMPEVALYEPLRALDGGVDGLDAYRLICATLPDILVPKGCAILEMGAGQIDAVAAIACEHGLQDVSRHEDLGGIARALVLKSV